MTSPCPANAISYTVPHLQERDFRKPQNLQTCPQILLHGPKCVTALVSSCIDPAKGQTLESAITSLVSLALFVRCEELLFTRHCWSRPTAQIFRSMRDVEAVPVRVKKIATSTIRKCFLFTVIALRCPHRARVCPKTLAVNFSFDGVRLGCHYPWEKQSTESAFLQQR